jgi:hypothetical protein
MKAACGGQAKACWKVRPSILLIIIGKYLNILSSKGIEPFTAINQFFYRESPLPIGSPALILFFIEKLF